MNPLLHEWWRMGIVLTCDGPMTCAFDVFQPHGVEVWSLFVFRSLCFDG